jgi:hypothetical protein
MSDDFGISGTRAKQKRYRRKPLEVAAVRWTGDNVADVKALLASEHAAPDLQVSVELYCPLWVRTVHDVQTEVPVGDYVVLDAKGYPYPCEAEIFEATHDLIDVRDCGCGMGADCMRGSA